MGGCTEVSATKVYHCCRSERLELLVVESFVCVAGWVEVGVGVKGKWEVGLIYVDFVGTTTVCMGATHLNYYAR